MKVRRAGVRSSVGKCLDVSAASTTPATRLQIWDCHGGINQVWTRTASDQLTVYSGNNLRCMTARGNETADCTPVVSSPCTDATGQRRRFNPDGTVTGVPFGLCLDINGGSTANGTRIILWSCHGGTNQQWRLGSAR